MLECCMLPSPNPPPALAAAKPAKESLPKSRHCRFCNKIFKPSRAHHWFCCARCRKNFHRDQTAYGALRLKLLKVIDKRVMEKIQELRAMLEECECKCTIRYDELQKMMAATHRQECT